MSGLGAGSATSGKRKEFVPVPSYLPLEERRSLPGSLLRTFTLGCLYDHGMHTLSSHCRFRTTSLTPLLPLEWELGKTGVHASPHRHSAETFVASRLQPF